MRTTTMDLGLSLELGESSSKQLRLVQNAEKPKGLALCMGFEQQEGRRMEEKRASNELSLLPLAPVPRNQPAPHLGLPWQTENRGIDVNQLPSGGEEGVAVCSPNSTLSSFQMDFSIHSGGGGGGGGTNGDSDQALGFEMEPERTSSRASDDDENGSARKKLRLSKEQAVYLEESFKEHNTLNPKQKLALAKQLNLRARQVEVWFQNRRARTKLKQTEVDCEYLKRCCEKLTEENRRLQKEIQELRALKACNPFYMQLPPTTLTMCPSCERVATTTTNNTTGAKATGVSLTNPRFCDPFSQPSAPPKSTAA